MDYYGYLYRMSVMRVTTPLDRIRKIHFMISSLKESSVDNSHRFLVNHCVCRRQRKFSTKGKVSSRKRTQYETGPGSGRTPHVYFRIHTSFVMEEWRLVLRK